eukprot:CAMPEP_0183437684 /NCGR_PEP_ID=MMETSP0370-20130417/74174_1 /TAXON_ID=268820 /ORGANISM="Peridinium aciculiferum, Strain PAER-2" /LENGTH=60 /DNA_ID=CAMNT_0025625583 /DNA_START=23 /DNA_END=201 /DNA_ORIENTATION=-
MRSGNRLHVCALMCLRVYLRRSKKTPRKMSPALWLVLRSAWRSRVETSERSAKMNTWVFG